MRGIISHDEEGAIFYRKGLFPGSPTRQFREESKGERGGEALEMISRPPADQTILKKSSCVDVAPFTGANRMLPAAIPALRDPGRIPFR
jgi:hypothetical protein